MSLLDKLTKEAVKIKIPKSVRIDTTVGDFIGRKINRVKMTDITTTEDFDVSVNGRDITIRHPNKKQLKMFSTRLKVLIKDSGNKLDKIIG
tara:strand:- start:2633 stop:2905 length:273 start_codon:yes stop_codon:yes gene_type:complete